MTEQEHDQLHAEPEVSATQVVNKFSADIKEAIGEVVSTTRQEIEDDIRADFAKKAAIWWTFTFLIVVAIAAGTAYLFISFWPRPHVSQFIMERGANVELCTRAVGVPPERPVFECVPGKRG